jgi:hypothetical protein
VLSISWPLRLSHTLIFSCPPPLVTNTQSPHVSHVNKIHFFFLNFLLLIISAWCLFLLIISISMVFISVLIGAENAIAILVKVWIKERVDRLKGWVDQVRTIDLLSELLLQGRDRYLTHPSHRCTKIHETTYHWCAVCANIISPLILFVLSGWLYWNWCWIVVSRSSACCRIYDL